MEGDCRKIQTSNRTDESALGVADVLSERINVVFSDTNRVKSTILIAQTVSILHLPLHVGSRNSIPNLSEYCAKIKLYSILTTRKGDMERASSQELDLAFLGSLVPGILHNMATPLSGVLGATQLLEKRVAALEDALHELPVPDDQQREELNKHLERNRSNVEILARNAKHLADVLQVIVQRINRCNGTSAQHFCLNELIDNELKFLEANLSFKHKVKKSSSLDPTLPSAQFIYAPVSTAFEEFVTGSMLNHDPAASQMEMNFKTYAANGRAHMEWHCRWDAEAPGKNDTPLLDSQLKQLIDDGWSVTHDKTPGAVSIHLSTRIG
jgi:hypothetical protein